jgi:hypothetical protein
MANEMFTQLPSVTGATLADIICAVQGGVSVQETLGQIAQLFNANVIINYHGNPNLNVAGTSYQFCWDSLNNILWVCTTTGSISTAVWSVASGTQTNGQLMIGSTGNAPVPATLTAGTNISISNGAGTITISATGLAGIGWVNVTGSTQTMVADTGYVADKASLVTFTLPTTAAFGTIIYVQGLGSGGWSIAQSTGQSIAIGSDVSTSGTGGSVSSTNQYDSVALLCVTANTTWTALTGVQGNLTVV